MSRSNERWRCNRSAIALLMGCALLVPFGCGSDSPAPPSSRILDSAGFLPQADRVALEERLDLLHRESGIDTRFEFTDSAASGDLDGYAVRRFEELGVGREGGQSRGLLFVYHLPSERLRIEVGYGLEGYFPDAFVGYLVDDHARYLFASGSPGFALLLTIRMLEYRIRVASLGGSFDPTFVRTLRAARHDSGGAGAAGSVAAADGAASGVRAEMPETWRARFAASDSVETSFQRYLDWLAAGVFDPDVTVFSPATRAFLRDWPMTEAYFDYVLFQEMGHRRAIIEAGDRAIVFSTSDPVNTPSFLHRSAAGWQLDIEGAVAEIADFAGGPYAWSFRGRDGPYASAFASQLQDVDGFLRLSAGDNRRIPVHRARNAR